VDDIGSRASGTMRPGVVDVAVLPPIPVEEWTLRDLDKRIATVRQLFVSTLDDWPRAATPRPPARRHK
jgi:putative phosphoserine phosphatase/1-acylglycerol-3-phosphate O-acyltransferase